MHLAHQQTTRDWRQNRRTGFDLFASELVILEASAGDATAAEERLAIRRPLPLLDLTEAAIGIADALVGERAVPASAFRDALHIGVCAFNGIDYPLTWNFRHLANAALEDRIRPTRIACGYRPPVICTPQELSQER